MSKKPIIVFEGIECSGKSLHSQNVANYLKKKGIKVEGPLVADTIFINDYKKFDVIVGMYHDQVIAPFKTLYKFDAINMTLGLKYLRVSPDHGTARDIIFKDKANPNSLIKCINTILKLG